PRAFVGAALAARALLGDQCRLAARPESQDRSGGPLHRRGRARHTRRAGASPSRPVWSAARRDAQHLRQRRRLEGATRTFSQRYRHLGRGNGMSDITKGRRALLACTLEGDGRAPLTQRRASFDNEGLSEPLSSLIDKVAKHAYKVTDEDIAAASKSG